MPNVETLLRDHVTLQVDCIDRLYLNGYVPLLQRPQNLWWYFVKHKDCPIPSPVLLKKWVDSFVADIRGFAARNRIPIIQFERHERKEDVARRRLTRFRHREGVVLVGVAQEKVNGFRTYQKNRRTHQQRRDGKPPVFAFYRGSIDVNQYYFYILDRDFGLCFIKFSSYPPFNVRVWLNGHEWAKRQLDHRGIAYEDLDNGFLSCADPARLQRTCDSLRPEDIDAFFRKWLRILPHPFTPDDRRVGFRYQLSIMQMEVSTTDVFDRPIYGRQFFEEVIRDNLDIGRPDRVQLLFDRHVRMRGPTKTPGSFRTRVLTEGVQPSLRFDYKRTKVKQYFKLARALRTETTFNDAYDFDVGRSLGNLPHLLAIGRNINHRVLSLERVAQHCAISAHAVERIVLPTVTADDQRAPALRWGDPRTMAVLSAVTGFAFTPEGFTNADLRARVGALYDAGPKGYTAPRMTYDLRRLRLKHLIQRVPKSHRYVFTAAGRRAALFLTKAYVRVVRPTLDRLDPQLPDDASDQLRRAWKTCENLFEQVTQEARIAA
jgi:hypothetical protein